MYNDEKNKIETDHAEKNGVVAKDFQVDTECLQNQTQFVYPGLISNPLVANNTCHDRNYSSSIFKPEWVHGMNFRNI